jgi:hypothetical protein
MNRYLLLLILFLNGITNIKAQNNLTILSDIGLENLAEIYELDHYYLSYENNRYRYEGDALVAVIEALIIPQKAKKVTLLIQNRGIGISSISFTLENFSALKKGALSSKVFADKAKFSFNVDDLITKFDEHEKINSSYFKVEAIVGLDVEYALGNFDNGVRQKINFQPEIFSVLGKGAVISGRYNFPTFNEIDNQPSYLQLARITQDIRWKDNVFLNLNFGFSSLNRYGLNTRLDRYLGSEKLRLRFDFGITKELYLDQNVDLVTINPINTFNMSGGIIYRWNRFDTDFSFRYGSFLIGDTGFKASMRRQFDEVFVGLFFNSTNFGQIAGFDFRIPLSTKRHMKNKGVRIRTKDYFSLEYNYRYDAAIALEAFNGSSVLDQIEEYFPAVLKKKLGKHLFKK